MKFLCVPCNAQMSLEKTEKDPELGALNVIWRCPKCAQETAMLTNPAETQLVTSLGVRIGPEGEAQTGASKCPFSAMIGGGDDTLASVEKAPEVQSLAVETPQDGVSWSMDANSRLEGVPEIVRPMARLGIEKYAREHGHQEITVAVLDKARASFGL